jgi:hypothetical protein
MITEEGKFTKKAFGYFTYMFIITLGGATYSLLDLTEDTDDSYSFSSPGFRSSYARYELRMCVCLPLDTSNPFKNRATVTNRMLII